MKSLLSLIAVALLFALPLHATTYVTGVPNVIQAPGTNGPCASFQVGTLNENFVIQTSDAGYVAESGNVVVALIRGLPITFTDAGVTVPGCQNYELAQNVTLGPPSCPNSLALDFTSLCDGAALAEIGAF